MDTAMRLNQNHPQEHTCATVTRFSVPLISNTQVLVEALDTYLVVQNRYIYMLRQMRIEPILSCEVLQGTL